MAQKVTFGADAFFDIGKSALRPEAKTKLDELASKVSSVNLEIIMAVGHSDSVGSDVYNQKLSVERAEAVKGYLVSAGIERNRIYTEGKGAKQPVADKKTAEGRAKNNRVEIEVVGAPPSPGSPTITVSWKHNDIIPVLFATNRIRTGSDNPYYFYGNDLADETGPSGLRRGIVVVRVPKDRDRGVVKRPGWIALTLSRIREHPLAHIVGIKPGEAADLRTQFSYKRPIEELTAPDFAKALKEAVNGSKSKTAVLYVHGFANDFTDAAFRTAQVVFDLERPDYDLVPLMFSWPSDPPSILGKGYETARGRSEAAGYDLARFLEEVAATTDIGTVHLIAHSMGAEVLGHAVLKLGIDRMSAKQPEGLPRRPSFRQIVFAAPDITPRIFADVIEPAIRTNHVITTYGATTDLPLWLSEIRNRQARAGNVNTSAPLPECVDTVDVTAVAAKGLAHSTWAEAPRVLDDIGLVLRYGLEPDKRGLNKRRLQERVVWSLPAAEPVAVRQILARRPTPKFVCVPR